MLTLYASMVGSYYSGCLESSHEPPSTILKSPRSHIPLLFHECITILIHRKKSMPLTPGWSVASPILEAYREDDRKRDRRWRFFSKLSLKSVFFFLSSFFLWFSSGCFFLLGVWLFFFCWVYIVIVDFDARRSWNTWWEISIFAQKGISIWRPLSIWRPDLGLYYFCIEMRINVFVNFFLEGSLQELIRMKEVNQWTLSAELQFSESKILWHHFSCIKTFDFQGPRVWAHWKLNSLKIQFASAILTRILCSILQNLGFHLCIKEDPWRSLKWCQRFFWGGLSFGSVNSAILVVF